jgi:quercetin dioxygenase-like cupin family protein
MNEQSTATDQSRLRQHPADRAIGDSQVLDLAAALEQLRAEDHPAPQGHRQVTVFHQSPVSMVLFAFTADGILPDHVAQGVVTIHVLEGALDVQVADAEHVLEQNQVLVLNPGVPHSVRASMPSAMLLTVNLAGVKNR